jgi:hypothetical protein
VTTPRPRHALVLALILLAAAGCSGDKPTQVGTTDGLPAGTPVNDTPAHTTTRFEATFDAQSKTEYAKLLTDDFRFHFSAQTDPLLASQYGDTWVRNDESISIDHLFNGFTNSEGAIIPGASRIEASLIGVMVVDDTSHVDSVAFYRKIVVSSMEMTVEVPSSPEPTLYQISSRQEIFVVRGDAAVLASGQAAQSDRWYIRRWDDLSFDFSGVKGPVTNPARSKSIGSLKALYR